MQEEDAVIIEEINHGFINDGYDQYLYEDSGKERGCWDVTNQTLAKKKLKARNPTNETID